MKNIINTKDVVNNLGYILIDEYMGIGYKRKVIIQDSDGYKYNVSLWNAKNNNLSIVHKKNPFSLENISIWLKLNRPEFELSDFNEYINDREKLKFYHIYCDEYFYMGWNSISQGQGCSVCRGAQVGKYNSLAYLRPDLEKQWNYNKNIISPNEITCGSNQQVYWTCQVCNYGEKEDWLSSPSTRTIMKTICPGCSGRVVTDRNRLSVLFPKIADEWHKTKNGKLTPNDVSFGSGRKAWWSCPNGHDYYSIIGERTNGHGCFKCASERQESIVATELKKYLIDKYSAIDEYRVFKNPKTKHSLPFDIYIPIGENIDINGIYIEINGKQHYQITNFHYLQAKKKNTTPEEEFEYGKQLDRMKRKYARKNGVYIEIDLRKIEITEQAIDYVEEIIGGINAE